VCATPLASGGGEAGNAPTTPAVATLTIAKPIHA